MMTIKFTEEESINFHRKTKEDVFKIIDGTITDYNYKIIDQTSNIVIFKPYGLKPVSRNEAVYYLNKGKFELIFHEKGNTIIRFTYYIAYSGEVFLGILTLIGYFFSHWVLLFFFIIIFSFLGRLKRINRDSVDMLLDIIDAIDR